MDSEISQDTVTPNVRRPLRIALVHSFYSSRLPSGENVVVESQAQALRDAGHEVLVLGRHTDELEVLPGYGARAATRVMTGRGGDPTRHLEAFAPDVVHVQNLFPNIGTQWLSQWHGPVVATVHNFRSVCANGLLFRDGHVCTQCPDGDRWAALRHSCYRGSRIATVPLVARNGRGIAGDPLLQRADRIVALSTYSAELLVNFGLDQARLSTIPNFVSEVTDSVLAPPEVPRWVFVGRLTQEKGFARLVEAWPDGIALDVIGVGPERGAAEGTGIRILGALPRDELRRRLPHYTGLILPSELIEGGIATTVVEAFEAGIPVIARPDTSAGRFIGETGAGLVWSERQSLASALAEVASAGMPLRRQARVVYEQHFTESRWCSAMERTYQLTLV